MRRFVLAAFVAVSLFVVVSTSLLLGDDGREVEVKLDTESLPFCLNAPIYRMDDGQWTTNHDSGVIDQSWLTDDSLAKTPTIDTATFKIRGDRGTLIVGSDQIKYRRLKEGEFTELRCSISN